MRLISSTSCLGAHRPLLAQIWDQPSSDRFMCTTCRRVDNQSEIRSVCRTADLSQLSASCGAHWMNELVSCSKLLHHLKAFFLLQGSCAEANTTNLFVVILFFNFQDACDSCSGSVRPVFPSIITTINIAEHANDSVNNLLLKVHTHKVFGLHVCMAECVRSCRA